MQKLDFSRAAQYADTQIACRPDAARQHASLIFIFTCDVSPTHDPLSICPFKYLDLAGTATALPATYRNLAGDSNLRTAEHGLIFRARKYLLTTFYVDLERHYFTPPAEFRTRSLKFPSSSPESRHTEAGSRSRGIRPAGSYSLCPRVELNAVRSIHVKVAKQ